MFRERKSLLSLVQIEKMAKTFGYGRSKDDWYSPRKFIREQLSFSQKVRKWRKRFECTRADIYGAHTSSPSRKDFRLEFEKL